MPKQLKFNFHNLVGIEITSQSDPILAYFSNEYVHYITGVIKDDIPRVRLRVEPRGYSFADSQKFTKRIHKVLARWKYRVSIQPGLIDIRAVTNHMGISMIHHMLVHPALRYLSAKQDVLMLHAGAVCLDSESILFSGKGGTGKTTTTSLLLAESGSDYSLHADDYVFIDHADSLSYVTRSHLYQDILKWVPEILPRLTLQEKMKIRIFGLVRKWSAENLKWPTRIPVSQLWPTKEICDKGKIKGLVYLSKEKTVRKPHLTSVPETDQIVESILDMNFAEAGHFISLLKSDQSVSGLAGWLKRWRLKEQELLKRFFNEIPVYQLNLPPQYDFSVVYKKQMITVIESLFAGSQPA